MTRGARAGCAAGSLAFFLVACAFPAIGTCSRDPAHLINWFENSVVVLFGWLGVFLFQLGWFANLPLVVHLMALMLDWRPRRWLLATHAVLLSIGAITLQPALGFDLPHNEAWSEPICRLGAGFWLWLAAHAVALAAMAIQYRARRAP